MCELKTRRPSFLRLRSRHGDPHLLSLTCLTSETLSLSIWHWLPSSRKSPSANRPEPPATELLCEPLASGCCQVPVPPLPGSSVAPIMSKRRCQVPVVEGAEHERGFWKRVAERNWIRGGPGSPVELDDAEIANMNLYLSAEMILSPLGPESQKHLPIWESFAEERGAFWEKEGQKCKQQFLDTPTIFDWLLTEEKFVPGFGFGKMEPDVEEPPAKKSNYPAPIASEELWDKIMIWADEHNVKW